MTIATVLFVVMVAGCGEPAAPEPAEPIAKEIRIGRPYDATTFDPANANDDGSYDILRMMGEGLVRNVGGKILPGIAERWEESEDGLEYTFYLRESTWSDGTPLDAHDFVYSYLRLLAPENAFNNAESALIFKNAERYMNGECEASEVGVTAVDDHILKIRLEKASLETLPQLASWAFFPVKKEAVEAAGAAYGSEAANILTNGPFNLVEWTHEAQMVLEKNKVYWNADEVKLTKITAIVGATGETAVDMMLAGELDFCTTNDYAQMTALKEAGFSITPYSSGYQFVHLNSKGSSEETGRFMANANFRKALNLAVSRKAIVTSVFTGAEAATRITAPDVAGVSGRFCEEYPFEGWPAEGDPDKAKACLQQALTELGATLEDVPTLSMLCFESQRSMTVLQAIQDMILNTLGIKCEIDPQPIQQMIAKAYSGDWDMWWGGKTVGSLDWASSDGWGGDFVPPAAGPYVYGWHNEEYAKLVEEIETARDIKVRKDTLFEMEKILCDDPPTILVGWTQDYACCKPGLVGIDVRGNYANLIYADLTK